jgi:hypothetical protein
MRLWSLHPDITAEVVPMRWSDPHETYAEKRHRLQQAIELSNDDRIVLVGESAGGSMAVTMYTEHSMIVRKLVTLCGKNHGEKNVSPRLYRRNPAFRESLQRADAAMTALSPAQRANISTIYSPHDHVVRPADTRIDGARAYLLGSYGHLPSIVYVLLFRLRLVRTAAS